MKRVLIALSALLFVNHVAADQAAVIVSLGQECTTASQYAKLDANGAAATCTACGKDAFLGGYQVKLAEPDSGGPTGGEHPACCSESGDIVCRAMMTAYKKGCQVTGASTSDKGASAVCTA